MSANDDQTREFDPMGGSEYGSGDENEVSLAIDAGESVESISRKQMLLFMRRKSPAAQLDNFLKPLSNPMQSLSSRPGPLDPLVSQLNLRILPAYNRAFPPKGIITGSERRADGVEECEDVDEREEDAAESQAAEMDTGEVEGDMLQALHRKMQLVGGNAQQDRPALKTLEGEYVSPYTRAGDAAAASGAVDMEWKYRQCAAKDLELHAFLQDIARNSTDMQLEETQAASRLLLRLFAETPFFIGTDQRMTAVEKDKMSSFSPCIFEGYTEKNDGTVVPHLNSLLMYMFGVPGTIRVAFQRASREDRLIMYGELLGSLDSLPEEADAVTDPGIYVINPISRCCIIGMSHSLGLRTRTRAYSTAVYKYDNKLGRVQNSLLHSDWPGSRFAIMHHGSTCAMSALPIPSTALYAAESVLIVATGAWSTPMEDVDSELADNPRQPTDPALAKLPVIGLNTTFMDRAGAYLRQPALNIAGARDLIRRLGVVTKSYEPLPEWDYVRQDQDDQIAIAAWYHRTFSGIFTPTAPFWGIYQSIKFRTAVMQRAAMELPQEVAEIVVDVMPGKHPLSWKKGSWL